ncbi:variable surface protein [Plasmodium gonderi]|uniref:Variable surface protein n=1 Tax=Plasmodium gonderi TaxID=77519 RepID=A0A1Y1JAP8_PLAGO|nr:variable surface protein [Plasmodium gonderi]GAW79589.1 variable surface protein [Plasmodium gonderi]
MMKEVIKVARFTKTITFILLIWIHQYNIEECVFGIHFGKKCNFDKTLHIRNERLLENNKELYESDQSELNDYLEGYMDKKEIKKLVGDIPLYKEVSKCEKNSLHSCNEVLYETTTEHKGLNPRYTMFPCLNRSSPLYKRLRKIDYNFEKRIFDHLEKLDNRKLKAKIYNNIFKRALFIVYDTLLFFRYVILLAGTIFCPTIFYKATPQNGYAVPYLIILATFLLVVFYIIVKFLKYDRLKDTMRIRKT